MPIIIGIFCALPFLAGLIAEYLVCRLTRRRWWKLLPPAAAVALTAAVAVGRIAGAVCPAGPAGGLAAVETAVGPAGGEG